MASCGIWIATRIFAPFESQWTTYLLCEYQWPSGNFVSVWEYFNNYFEFRLSPVYFLVSIVWIRHVHQGYIQNDKTTQNATIHLGRAKWTSTIKVCMTSLWSGKQLTGKFSCHLSFRAWGYEFGWLWELVGNSFTTSHFQIQKVNCKLSEATVSGQFFSCCPG